MKNEDVVSFTTRPLYPRGKSHRYPSGWVNPTAGLDNVEKRKFLPLPRLELRPSVVQPVASRYTDYATPAPIVLPYEVVN
jgi:hypothetical protein